MDSIKSHRKQTGYRKLVDEIRNSSTNNINNNNSNNNDIDITNNTAPRKSSRNQNNAQIPNIAPRRSNRNTIKTAPTPTLESIENSMNATPISPNGVNIEVEVMLRSLLAQGSCKPLDTEFINALRSNDRVDIQQSMNRDFTITLAAAAGSSGRNHNKNKKQNNVDQHASSHETSVGSGGNGRRPHIVLEEEEGASRVSGNGKPRSRRGGRCNEKRQDTHPSLSTQKVTSTQEMKTKSNAIEREIEEEIMPEESERDTEIMPTRGTQSTTSARSCLTPKPTSKRVTRRRAKRAEYANAQNLFGKDRGALLRKLLVGEDLAEAKQSLPGCSRKEMLEFWEGVMTTESAEFTGTKIPIGKMAVPELITEDEVKTGLKALHAGAPGLDQIRKADLIKVGIPTLTQRFNIYLLTGLCPEQFKEGLTTLIPKSKRPSNPAEFRPITVSSMAARLLHKIITKRIEKNVTLNPRQKAFLRRDGIAENIFLLKNIISSHTNHCRQLMVCFLDVSKAFDSVSHDSIIASARRAGIPEVELNYINNLYKDSTTRFKLDGGNSEKINIRRGVKQGDPLSPMLFNTVIDYVLSKLDNNLGITINKHRVTNLAFADDLVLFGENKASIQKQIERVIGGLKECGLTINPSKCASIHIVADAKKKTWACDPTPCLCVNDTMVKSLSINEGYKYLGIKHSADPNHRSSDSIVEEFRDNCSRIASAPLKPHQKLDLLINRLMPGLTHTLTFSYTPKSCLIALDRIARANVRAWLRLPKDFTLGAFHAPNKVGGLGLPRLEIAIPLTRYRRIGRITRENDDSVICTLARSTILRWSRAPTLDSQILITNELVKQYHSSRLLLSIDGAGLDRAADAPYVNNWIRNNANNNLIRAHNYVNMVKLKHNTLTTPVRTKRAIPEHSTTCRGCDHNYCTLHHILQRCPLTHVDRVKRHDSVTRLVENQLNQRGYKTYLEQHIRTIDGGRKPDLIALKTNTAYIIDTQICSDSINPDERYDGKVTKYDKPEIRQHVKDLTGSTHVRIGACIFNWRGTPSKKTAKLMMELGLTKKDIELQSIRTLETGTTIYRAFNRRT